MKPFKLTIKDPEFGIVVTCKHYFGLSSRAYYLCLDSSQPDDTVWRCCLTDRQVKDKGLSAFVMQHLLGRIREFYPSWNFS